MLNYNSKMLEKTAIIAIYLFILFMGIRKIRPHAL